MLLYGDRVKEIHGGESDTTNQRMEIKAVIEALRALKVSNWRLSFIPTALMLSMPFSRSGSRTGRRTAGET